MHYIYVDEAGTSTPEPVTVVVGIIVDAEKGWGAAASRVREIIHEFVPEKFQTNFVFHAKSIWGDKRYRDEWSIEDRAAFISAMVSLPRDLHLAVAIGKVRRDSGSLISGTLKAESDHLLAFAHGMWRANKYVRDWGHEGEIATVVAEDVSEKKQQLKDMLNFTRANPGPDPKRDPVRLTLEEQLTGKIVQNMAGEVDRIIDTVHFVKKEEAPLIQIADACAFVFRRYFAEQEYGKFWQEAMIGNPLVWEDWQGPVSGMLFSFNPRRRYRTWMKIPRLRAIYPWRRPRW